MMLIELFVPTGVLTEDQRLVISERLVTELMRAENAPADLIERGRALTHVVINESPAMAGGRPLDPAQPPRYWVRVTVPGGHLNGGMRAETVGRITCVLAEIEADPQRLYQEPSAWVSIVEVPEGNMGTFGQTVRLADILQMVTKPGFKPAPTSTVAEDAATLIDPICGMTVALTETAITLERDGTTYAFCSTTCRDLFA